jgi:hypothetical protein
MDRPARIVAGEGKDMTPEDIIRMAREAGLAPIYSGCDVPNVSCAYEDWDEELERFAALVAAAEREACAKVCETEYEGYDWADRERDGAEACAAAIRARSKA